VESRKPETLRFGGWHGQETGDNSWPKGYFYNPNTGVEILGVGCGGEAVVQIVVAAWVVRLRGAYSHVGLSTTNSALGEFGLLDGVSSG
jgi:hypothetical protein